MVSREMPATVELMQTAMRQVGLGVEHGTLDPSPYNEAGAAYFVYGAPGAQQRALVMVRTVRGTNRADCCLPVDSLPLPLRSAESKATPKTWLSFG